VEKADLSKVYPNPQRKLGADGAFLEITELKFGKKMLYTFLYFKFGRLIISEK